MLFFPPVNVAEFMPPHNFLLEFFVIDCWHFCTPSFLDPMSRAKRCPWETTATQQGLRLEDFSELYFPNFDNDDPPGQWPIACLADDMKGVAFATKTSLEKYQGFRSNAPLALITKGFETQHITRLGFEPKRILNCTLTVYDHVNETSELRALTLINLAACADEFVSLPEHEHEVKVQTFERMAVFFELRQCDAAADHWSKLSPSSAFETYVDHCLMKCGIKEASVKYKTFKREGYLCLRAQIPTAARNQLYHLSGDESVQIKAVRSPKDPPEEGLEVLKLESNLAIADLADKHKGFDGSLGFFRASGCTYFRTTDGKLAEARALLFGNDGRFTQKNAGMKLVHYYRVQGFPLGVSYQEVAQSLEDLGWCAIPTKIVSLAHLSLVIAASNQKPIALKFHTSIGLLTLQALEKPTKQQKATVAVAPKPSRPQSAFREQAQVKRMGPFAPPSFAAAAASSASLAPPSASLSNRVAVLEKQMTDLKKDQDTLDKKVTDLGTKQDRGFADLMAAIGSLKSDAGQPSTPVKSPPHKISKQK